MKRKMLAICGTAPQIITEMLYALWQLGKLPDEVHVVTTKAGKEAIYTKLLHPKDGIFFAFCKEYDIPPSSILFSWKTISVPLDSSGREIEDIRTESDSVAFLRLCLEKTFEITATNQDSVFFSIAAGRKTMGAVLTLAAQYYGRKQDRLYHILVSEEFEYSPLFYYPPKIEKCIELTSKNGEKYFKSTEYATISLINIPFFSIREQLSKEMLAKAISPDEIMTLFTQDEDVKLVFSIQYSSITWGNKTITMSVAWFVLYLFFAQHKKNTSLNDSTPHLELNHVLDAKDTIARLYTEVNSFQIYKDATKSDTGILSLTPENFRSYKSKINAKIKRNFGTEGVNQIGISSFGKKPDTTYGLWIPSSSIHIVTPEQHI